ncbi:MAG: DUF1738 domain-containing protein [Armatimonadetes bacterium]|nr:DUF1738 domain-containing protein [Armatimonadota bacterium]
MNDKVYEQVTAQITNALMRGVVPWRKPWAGGDSLPANAVSKKPYRGVNVFLLALSPFRDHRWLTFNQAKELGGTVRRGERSTPVVFWKPWNVEGTDQETGEVLKWRIPILKKYHVFNAEQCDGLELPSLSLTSSEHLNARIDRAEAFVKAVQDPPTIREQGASAWYRPAEDVVQIPPLSTFDSPDAYYATLLHELGHATGHEKRLNRPSVTGEVQFGSACYGREELVAELTSAFCCASIGLDNSLVENSASYIESWLTALKSDTRAVVVAASKAQKAADYLHGVSFEEEPA